MRKGKDYELNIVETEFPAVGVAYHEGERVLVKGCYPGQKITAKISKKRRDKIEGRLLKVLEEAPYAIETPCPVTHLCGGCSSQQIPYEKQLEFKKEQIEKLFKAAKIEGFEYEGIEESPEVFEYRNKMEFTFGDMEKGGELTLGMHVKRQSFSVVTVDKCKIVDEDFTTILRVTLDYFKNKGLKYYRIMSREGYLRNLVVRKGINTGEILVNLVTTSQENFDLTEWKELVLSLELKGQIVGVVNTINDSFSDVVQCDRLDILEGREYIYEELLGLKFKINPFAFFQTNTKGAEKLYSIVREYIGNTDNKVVFDLYCGTGTIGQIVAPKAEKVVGIELIEEAVEAAKENAKLNNLNNCKFIAGDVAKVITQVKDKPDVIILDPPRAGIHPVAMKYVIEFNAQEIVYVSCNPKTLVTDLQVLIENGYKIEKVRAKDMFPNTPHVETCALLVKSSEA
ncbi:23S rRNA m(5)U-1939 methyltransferase [Clostridium collagenovorans DSM 3089]|uniref:23S rRNA m(5)U-1939 methyltransferase n=1 Tax=Clostridium collagenovorans DSM 3089 TaxID=1121306 RepID=A0A1M5SDG1_9CLOT|nr:23S rRNA (uracil(1939)-C(5))-methyltransferase RlmD [Clostridium collagenovorans]SHH36574.1 23S rRNA m(5)U-1939 methyltransferase [Clostridium collagenovorans DSM 3089]